MIVNVPDIAIGFILGLIAMYLILSLIGVAIKKKQVADINYILNNKEE